MPFELGIERLRPERGTFGELLYSNIVSDRESTGGQYDSETEFGVEYTAHSMMHKGLVDMDPTKLELLDDFESTDSGHKFTPPNSNIRVMITGRDWSEKRILIYGGSSTEEAREHFEEIMKRVRKIGHEIEPIGDLEITNIAVNGDFGKSFNLERIMVELNSEGLDVDYEPEQFPGLIVELDNPPVTFLLFSTGKFSLQGIRHSSQIDEAIDRMQELV